MSSTSKPYPEHPRFPSYKWAFPWTERTGDELSEYVINRHEKKLANRKRAEHGFRQAWEAPEYRVTFNGEYYYDSYPHRAVREELLKAFIRFWMEPV